MFFEKEKSPPAEKMIESLGTESAMILMRQTKLFATLLEILIEKGIITEDDFRGRTTDPIESARRMGILAHKLSHLTFCKK